MKALFIRTRPFDRCGKQDVIPDGAYPFDENTIGWKMLAYITMETAHKITNIKGGDSNSILNKTYIFYSATPENLFAVYNHDGEYSIISCDAVKFDKKFAADSATTPDKHPIERIIDPDEKESRFSSCNPSEMQLCPECGAGFASSREDCKHCHGEGYIKNTSINKSKSIKSKEVRF